MPELPEVEVSRLGLLPLVGKRLESFIARRPDLRLPIPDGLNTALRGKTLAALKRRGKYLLFHWPEAEGWLILHLGMSGSLRLVNPPAPPPGKHDHIDFVFPEMTLRFRDPRRFGLVDWQTGNNPLCHPLLARLGLEPLPSEFTPEFTPEFTSEWLARLAAGRKTPIKSLIMDASLLVGVGNIYAAESLFRAGIDPRREAGKISRARLLRLTVEICATLREAIVAGGSSLRDYVHSDGGAGSFQLHCAVYGREGQPCPRCETPIRRALIAGRSSFYCPHCQH